MGVLRGPSARLRLYVYDFREPGGEVERRKVRETLESHGALRLQYSTYALLAEPEVHSRVLREIVARVDFREGDSLLIVPVCRRCLRLARRVDVEGVGRLRF
ncbi:CRISPR-associated endonuclease Cas2 [Methanopyrus sp.]